MATARILVVDDDPAFLYLTCRELGDRYEVLAASCPRKALQIVRSNPDIDLVISDVQMPEMLGPQLLREISQISPRIVGVLVSASSTPLPELPPYVPLHLQKPLSRDEWVSIIEMVLTWSAQVRNEIRSGRERNMKERERAQQLCSESVELRRRAAELLQESRRLCRLPPESED